MAPATQYSHEPSCSYSDYETDFPNLNSKFEKRSTVKGRRCGVEQRQADIGRRFGSITKIVDDPERVLSQKRKTRLLKSCADNMVEGVQYSLNRKNRWELTPSQLLENAENTDDVNVMVANSELIMNRYWTFGNKSRAVHKMDKDGVVKTYKAGGMGFGERALLKEGETLENGDDSESSAQKAHLVYRVAVQHPNDRVFFGKSERKGYGKYGWRTIPRRNKLVDMSDLDLSEMENSVHLEENETYKPSRDFKFSLGDFINASTAVPVNIRRQSIESIKNIEEIDKDELPKESRPFDLIDISSITSAEHVYEKTFIPTTNWESYNFCQQVDALSADEKIIVKWLDPSHLRAAIDVSAKLGFCERPEMFIVVDRCRKGSIGVLLNTSIPAYGPMNDNILKNILVHQKSKSVDDIVRILHNLVLEWKIRFKKSDADSKVCKLSEFSFKSDRAPTLSRRATVVTESEMAEILRTEADNCEDEPFERISDDEFSSEEDSQGFETTIVGTIKIKCAICEDPRSEDLFEMDDCWQCINCARQNILIQIKGKYLPIDAAFVTDSDSSPYDVLPAILPLPVFNYYTRAAAVEILENSQDEINDLSECPTCRNVVKVERPHEYSSCCCSGCSTVWCLECKNEPHWPLTCAEFADWSDKWTKQYPNGLPRSKSFRFTKRFTCDCTAVTDVDDLLAETLVCHKCRKVNDPSMIVETAVKFSVKRQREIRGGKKLAAHELPRIRRPIHTIRKDVADLCAEARLQRYTKPKTKFMKCVRTYKNIPQDKIYDLRRTILLVVEYGLAKMYLAKIASQGLRTSVTQLLKQFEELVVDVEELKTTVEDSVKQLDAAVNKVIEQFKVIDLV